MNMGLCMATTKKPLVIHSARVLTSLKYLQRLDFKRFLYKTMRSWHSILSIVWSIDTMNLLQMLTFSSYVFLDLSWSVLTNIH